MALNFKITENYRGADYPSVALATHEYSLAIDDIVINSITDRTIETYATTPTVGSVKYNTSAGGRTEVGENFALGFYIGADCIRKNRWHDNNYPGNTPLVANANGTIKLYSQNWYDFKASDFFNSATATENPIDINVLVVPNSSVHTGKNAGVVIGYRNVEGQDTLQVATQKLILEVPPTFTKSSLYFNKPWVYAGVTTASIDIDNITAYYGGYIVEAKLTIGNQTAILTGDDTNILSSGTLSILLDTVGTFTPTITVTDSRGQVKTESLADITVLGYNAPRVVLSVDRTDSTGAHDDEGTYAVVTGTFTFTDAIATLSQPTVSVSGLPSPTVTWYETRSSAGVLSNPVDWSDTSSFSTGKTLYGLIGTLQANESYVITVTPNDSEGTGTAMSVTLATAFYTVDFLAGGHGIAFGKPATQTDLFECDLDAQFNNDVSIGGELTVTEQASAENLLLQLDTTAVSGTDKDIYDALVALGWDSDVIV